MPKANITFINGNDNFKTSVEAKNLGHAIKIRLSERGSYGHQVLSECLTNDEALQLAAWLNAQVALNQAKP